MVIQINFLTILSKIKIKQCMPWHFVQVNGKLVMYHYLVRHLKKIANNYYFIVFYIILVINPILCLQVH